MLDNVLAVACHSIEACLLQESSKTNLDLIVVVTVIVIML